MSNVTILYSRSVLQTSFELFSRFNELLKIATLLNESCKEGDRLLPGYTNIIGDVWVAFYAKEVTLRSNSQSIDLFQQQFMEGLFQSDEYLRWYDLTNGDELLSALTAIAISEQLKELLKKQSGSDEQKQQRERIENSERFNEKQLEKLKQEASQNPLNKEAINRQIEMKQKRLLQLKEEKKQLKQQASKQSISKQQVTQMIDKAIPSVKKAKKTIQQVGTMDGKRLNQVPISDQFDLALQLRENPTLIKIADLVGRYKKIATKKQKTKQRDTMERQSITFGQELSRLLPLEVANLLLTQTKKDFYMRFASNQALIFDTKGKDRRGRGPMIVCIDESSSMQTIKEESKAFCIALLMIARKQKRDFAIIPFASTVGEVEIYKKGQASTTQIVAFSNRFLGGGTNYEKPLQRSLEILQDHQFKHADIVFVTDGSSFLSTNFINHFNDVKEKKKFECTTIALTNLFSAVDVSVIHRFSDRVMEVQSLLDAEEVFAIK